jgi:hypothetical protein
MEHAYVSADFVLDLVVARQADERPVAPRSRAARRLAAPYSRPSSTIRRAALAAISALWVAVIGGF